MRQKMKIKLSELKTIVTEAVKTTGAPNSLLEALVDEAISVLELPRRVRGTLIGVVYDAWSLGKYGKVMPEPEPYAPDDGSIPF
jgi:hypothetical protein